MSQHMDALKHGNEIRLARAAIRRRVRDRDDELTAPAVLMDIPAAAVKMTILDLLSSQRQWGRLRSVRVLRAAGIPEMKQLGELTDRQRSILLRHL